MPGANTTQLLVKLEEQWTLTDITTPGVMERFVLPPDLGSQIKTSLAAGQYSLQVNDLTIGWQNLNPLSHPIMQH